MGQRRSEHFSAILKDTFRESMASLAQNVGENLQQVPWNTNNDMIQSFKEGGKIW